MQEVPADSGNFPWYMTDSIAVGIVRSDRVKLLEGGGGGGLIFETNCIFEYKPSPHFRLDVVYKMGGRINGTLRYIRFSEGSQ